jgi:hypothetical protein
MGGFMAAPLWKSKPLRKSALADGALARRIRMRAEALNATDDASDKDLLYLFSRYNSNPQERDAIDAAFVWFTGYTLATIAEMERVSNRRSTNVAEEPS